MNLSNPKQAKKINVSFVPAQSEPIDLSLNTTRGAGLLRRELNARSLAPIQSEPLDLSLNNRRRAGLLSSEKSARASLAVPTSGQGSAAAVDGASGRGHGKRPQEAVAGGAREGLRQELQHAKQPRPQPAHQSANPPVTLPNMTPFDLSKRHGVRSRHQLRGFDPRSYFQLVDNGRVNFRGGVVVEQSWQIKITKPIPGNERDQLRKTLAILQFALDSVIAKADPDVTAQLFVSHPNILTETRASRRLKAKDLSLDEILDRLEEIIQSSKSSPDDEGPDQEVRLEEVTWVLVTFKPRQIGRGGAFSKRKEMCEDDYITKSASMIDLSNPRFRLSRELRDSCLLNCVAYAVARYERAQCSAVDARQLAGGLRRKVVDLAAAAGIIWRGPHELSVLKPVQELLGPSYQIAVYTDCAPPVITFGENSATFHINIYVKKQDAGAESPAVGHAVLITKMSGFFGKNYCELCKVPYTRRIRAHKCGEAQCGACNLRSCLNSTSAAAWKSKRCMDCNEAWKTPECFQAHLTEMCSKAKRCHLCWEVVYKKELPKHKEVCGRPFCKKACKSHHLPFERCFVPTGRGGGEEEWKWDNDGSSDEEDYSPVAQSDITPKEPRFTTRCYGDFETAEDPVTGDHRPIVLRVDKVQDGQEDFQHYEYLGESCATDFVRQCFSDSGPFKNSCFVFHNLNGFDGHIILNACRSLGVKFEVVRKQQKILTMQIKSIVFRDSLLFLPGVPLSKFPNMFGLDCGDKGYFPFKLQGTRHVDFKTNPAFEAGDGSRFPALEWFGVEGMRPGALGRLKAWHAAEVAKFQSEPGQQYFATYELLKYCRQDVRILREGFEAYRKTWRLQFPDMDVLDYLTFPQFNNAVYRRHFLAPKSIAIIPPQGFQRLNNAGSVEAFCWLQMERMRQREAGAPLVEFRDARRGFEVCLSGVKVDGCGLDSQGQRHVYQYHGCYYHACPKCQKGPRTAEQDVRYERTLEDSERLRALGANPDSPYGSFTYHEIWSHEFYVTVRSGGAKAYWRSFRKRWPKEPLRPRDGFFGGRTNAIKHNVRVKEGWRLAYVDFTSLYPAVGYGTHGERWPLGPPKVFIGPDMDEEPDFPSLSDAFGFWKVTVHPPHQLRHPVLPQVINSRLVFALCRTCAVEEVQGLCQHSRDERAIHGVFFTEELKKAVEMGYVLDTPMEAWEWPEAQRTKKMFRRFIRELYAKKVLSSAAPSDPAEMAVHLEEQRTSVKLKLNPKDFKKDSCLRALSKFSINNIWGYHGKRGNYTLYAQISGEEELYALLNRKDIEVSSMRVVEEGSSVAVTYRAKTEEPQSNGSIAIAMMTTAYARLRLYEVLQAFPRQVVYFDTDSAFLLLPPGMAGPKTSSRLGDLKDEVAESFGPGHYISRFCSLGPKTYSYTVVNTAGEVVHREYKAKGISLTAEALKQINAAAMEEMTEERDKALRVPQFRISRDMLKSRLFSQHLFKRFAFSSAKRFFLPEPNEEMDTLPFGYAAHDDQELDHLIQLIQDVLSQ